MKARIIALGLLALSAPVWAAPPPVEASLDQRLQRIERMLRNQSLSDIMLRLQRLQQEVQQLRGELEIQAHAIESIKKRQRDLYLDIDKRLSQMKGEGAGASSPAAPASTASGAPTPAPTPSAAKGAAVSGKSPAGGEEEEYQKSFGLLRQGRYDQAIAAFKSFLKRYPGSDFADNAQYWLAEAYYVNQDFKAALQAFTKVVDAYGSSPKVPGAMLKIGYVHQELHENDEARAVFNRLIKAYPDSSEARLAKRRLEALDKR